VQHADAVAALVGSLRVGDPCPVCGVALAELPPSPGAKALRVAERAEAGARKRDAEAATVVTAAERGLDRARSGVESAEREAAAASEEAGRCERDANTLEAAIRKALGELPDDPVSVVQERIANLEALVRAALEADGAVAAAERELNETRGLRERIAAEAATARAGLEAASLADVASRATRVDAELTAPAVESLPAAADLAALAAAARSWADAFGSYGDRLAAAAHDRAGSEPRFLAEASEAVEGLVPPARSLAEIAEAVGRAERDAIREHEQCVGAADRIRADLEKVATLRDEVRALRERARVFQALAQELRADRLMAFLQAEALRLLAVGGSKRLAELSTGRYELAYQGDEFLVMDRWNGDETRSVRTLSGGETFLASLALALALAEQVSSLAVTRHASLDSLFLDEGFGTLDPETLEVVVEAIEQLGGDGRMVGVITHVRELADRLPARLEVEKSPRGSTVSRAP
jgi:exonuclease SbcC